MAVDIAHLHGHRPIHVIMDRTYTLLHHIHILAMIPPHGEDKKDNIKKIPHTTFFQNNILVLFTLLIYELALFHNY
jgi:hypothetical protein